MNRATIIGRLGADAELKHTNSGLPVLSMRVAVNERRKHGDQWVEDTTWFGVAVFGKRAEALDKLQLTKGTQVCAVGPVKTRAYTSHDGEARASLDLVAKDLHLLGGGKRREQRQDDSSDWSPSAANGPPVDDGFGDDEIPF